MNTDRGSATHGGLLPRGNVRALPEPSRPPRWPSERHLVPQLCAHGACGGRVYVTEPTVDDPETEASCLNCGRAAVSLIADGWVSSRERAVAAGAYGTSKRGRPRKVVSA